MKNKTQSGQEVWETVGGWWEHAKPSDFDPLISFANQSIQEENWQDCLWKAMGQERSCWVTYTTIEGDKRERIRYGDIMTHVSIEIGLGWFYPVEKMQEAIATITTAIKEEKPYLPKIFGGISTFELSKKLQSKVRQILDDIIARSNIQQVRSLLEACHEILEKITTEFKVPETRQAVVSVNGFLFFDDEGEDAARTLSWMLAGFVDIVFGKGRTILKKCQWCEKYFIHETKRQKVYCADQCRFDHYNKYKRTNER